MTNWTETQRAEMEAMAYAMPDIDGDILRSCLSELDRRAARIAVFEGEEYEALIWEAQRLLHRYSTSEDGWRRLTERFLDLLGEPHKWALDPEDEADTARALAPPTGEEQ